MVFGLGLVKFEVLDSLAAARAHQNVSYHEKGVVIAPFFIILGVLTLASTLFANPAVPKPKPIKPSPTKPSAKVQIVAVLLIVVIGGAGFALRAWFLSELASLGHAPR